MERSPKSVSGTFPGRPPSRGWESYPNPCPNPGSDRGLDTIPHLGASKTPILAGPKSVSGAFPGSRGWESYPNPYSNPYPNPDRIGVRIGVWIRFPTLVPPKPPFWLGKEPKIGFRNFSRAAPLQRVGIVSKPLSEPLSDRGLDTIPHLGASKTPILAGPKSVSGAFPGSRGWESYPNPYPNPYRIGVWIRFPTLVPPKPPFWLGKEPKIGFRNFSRAAPLQKVGIVSKPLSEPLSKPLSEPLSKPPIQTPIHTPIFAWKGAQNRFLELLQGPENGESYPNPYPNPYSNPY